MLSSTSILAAMFALRAASFGQLRSHETRIPRSQSSENQEKTSESLCINLVCFVWCCCCGRLGCLLVSFAVVYVSSLSASLQVPRLSRTQNCSEDPANKRCDAGRWKKGCLKRQDSSIGVAHLSSVNVAVDDRFSGKSKKKVKLKLKVITNMLGWAALACIVGLQK